MAYFTKEQAEFLVKQNTIGDDWTYKARCVGKWYVVDIYDEEGVFIGSL